MMTTTSLHCAVCVRTEDNSDRWVDPITQIAGTPVCRVHVSWIALPLRPTNEPNGQPA